MVINRSNTESSFIRSYSTIKQELSKKTMVPVVTFGQVCSGPIEILHFYRVERDLINPFLNELILLSGYFLSKLELITPRYIVAHIIYYNSGNGHFTPENILPFYLPVTEKPGEESERNRCNRVLSPKTTEY